MGRRRFIVAGRLIDGSGSNVQRNIFLKVKDGLISDIGSASDLPRDDQSVIEDLSHCTIVPALVDCSISLSQSPAVDGKIRLAAQEADLVEKKTLVEQHIRYCHEHGVLGVVANEDLRDLMKYYQEGEKKQLIDTQTSSLNVLKIFYSANIEDEEIPNSQLNSEDLRNVLQNKDKKKAIVIANGRQQVEEAIEAGCDAIEQGYDMGEANLRKMAEKEVMWIPSVIRAKNTLDSSGTGGAVCCRFSQRYVAPGKTIPGAKDFWKRKLAEHIALLRLARKLGVTTAMGTGAGSMGILHGESMVEEMKLFLKAGYSLEETIQCASENGAQFSGLKKLGTIKVGRKATFLIARGTIKQLPRKLSYLEGIYVDGLPSSIYRKNPYQTK